MSRFAHVFHITPYQMGCLRCAPNSLCNKHYTILKAEADAWLKAREEAPQ